MADVHEIAEGIFRIASYNEQAGLAFTQFLIRDEQPLLFHTGQRGIFQDTLAAVRTLIDPATLRYVSWSHWEGDESGALNDFLGVAPAAEPVHGALVKASKSPGAPAPSSSLTSWSVGWPRLESTRTSTTVFGATR